MMQAILIDPFTETIELVDYSGDYKDIYTLLECDLFATVYIDDCDTIYVDDEGLYQEPQRFFQYKGMPQPLAGRGLILGTDEEGDSTDCLLTVEQVRDMVTWCADDMPAPEPRFDVMGFDEASDLLEALGIDTKDFTGTVTRGK